MQGVVIGVPLFAFGHDPNIYGSDVEAFRPGRWLSNSSSKSSTTSSSYGSNNINGGVTDAAAGSDVNASIDSLSDAVAAVDPAAAAAAKPSQSGLNGNAKLQDPWTFSIGPRDCAGQALARMELQAVIATLVGRFHVQLAPEVGGWEGLLARRMYHTTLQAQGGLPMLLQPRFGGRV